MPLNLEVLLLIAVLAFVVAIALLGTLRNG